MQSLGSPERGWNSLWSSIHRAINERAVFASGSGCSPREAAPVSTQNDN
jgi:hypothetical protein